MSGYRPGYSEQHSPYYLVGRADGARDADAVAGCPMGSPAGMDPERAWSWMYKRGYHREWDRAIPHGSCARCDPNQRQEAS